MLNLSVILETSARKYPNHPAFTFGDTTLTYAQVNGAANQVANGLVANGIRKGDKIALNCLNLPFFPIVYFGILKAGAVCVPLSVLLKKEETTYHLENSEAKAFFCFIGTEELPMGQMGFGAFNEVGSCEQFFTIMPDPAAPSPLGTATLGSLMNGQSPVFDPVETSSEDLAVIIYTSGTTGQPKGAMLTHNNLMLNAILSADLVGTSSSDTQLIVLPLFHIFAMTVLMNAGIYRGAHSILLPRFEADTAIGLMRKHKVTVFAGVPTMFWGLNGYQEVSQIDEVSQQLRIAVSGGASLPEQVLTDFEAKYGVTILEGYGMSEGSPVVSFNHGKKDRKVGSIGTPVWGVQVKLVDDDGKEVPVGEKGELCYKGHNVMKGYYNKPEATAKTIQDGWLHSGDVAVKDEEGYFFIVDRTKDMIIRGGLNVYPREVEEVMIKHEAVSLVAVIGIQDHEYGEEIQACVVLNEGATCTEDELREWTKERIAAYKYPRRIDFVDSLPMSATGKILKKEIRKKYP